MKVFFLTACFLLTLSFGQDSEDCLQKNYGDSCGFNYECSQQLECEYIPLIPVVQITFKLGWIFILIIIGISTVGGIGGGIEKIPIMMIYLNYTEALAAVLVQATMFGCSVTNLFLLLPQRHFEIDRPIIDYDIALILLPTIILGTDIGYVLNQVFPEITLLLLMFISMIILIPLLLKKAQLYREIEERNRIVDSIQTSIMKKNNVLGYEDVLFKQPIQAKNLQIFTREDRIRHLFQQFQETDKLIFPHKQVLWIVGIFLFFQFIIIARGGHKFLSIFEIGYESIYYWLVSGIMTVSLLVISYFVKQFLNNKQTQMKDVGYLTETNLIRYTWRSYISISLVGFISSFMAGATGLGTGSLMVPMLILLNLQPRVAAATTGFVKFFISISAIVLVLINDPDSLNHILFFSSLGFLGAFFITYSIYQIINAKKYQFPIIYLVAGFLVLNAFSEIVYVLKIGLIQNNWDDLWKS